MNRQKKNIAGRRLRRDQRRYAFLAVLLPILLPISILIVVRHLLLAVVRRTSGQSPFAPTSGTCTTGCSRPHTPTGGRSSSCGPARGEYTLADDTYAELLDKLDDRQYTDVPPALRANIIAFYGAGDERVATLAGK